MIEVTIKIKSTQTAADGDENTIELMTEGKYYEKNNCIFLVYDESELSGMEGSTTTLKIKDQQVMMKRFGTNESELVFEEGKSHATLYRTPYGAMDMEVDTSEVVVSMGEDCIEEIGLCYDINISKKTETKNTLSIVVIKT